jgi:hypothetical protein
MQVIGGSGVLQGDQFTQVLRQRQAQNLGAISSLAKTYVDRSRAKNAQTGEAPFEAGVQKQGAILGIDSEHLEP